MRCGCCLHSFGGCRINFQLCHPIFQSLAQRETSGAGVGRLFLDRIGQAGDGTDFQERRRILPKDMTGTRDGRVPFRLTWQLLLLKYEIVGKARQCSIHRNIVAQEGAIRLLGKSQNHEILSLF